MKVVSPWVILILLLAAGCDQKQTVEISNDEPTESLEQNEESDASDDADAGSDAGQADEGDALGFFREVSLDGTPFDDKHQVMVIKYAGDVEEEVALSRQFDSDRIAAKFPAKPGAKLDFKQSMLKINKARGLKVKPPKLRLPATTFDDKKQKFGKDQVLEFSKGDVVFLLKYAAEGTCFVGKDGQIYNMTCPTPVEFEGEDWDGSPTPLEYDWWVWTSSGAARGWLVVDGKKFVHEVDEKATKRLQRKLRKKRRR